MSETTRSTLDICIAVSENDSNITDAELRMCVASLSSINRFYEGDIQGLVEAIKSDAAPRMLKLRAEFAWATYERMFNAQKEPMDKWLGPNNIPGSPGQQQRLRWAKGVYKKATGEGL